ncbi:helix-turn-helix transcriptional regulator [Sorangium sp. So ce233]|uniref:helix-turn-helix transcriptional regulator n=1 Tax=Sorangium sp. So ce233 TaxID=3133290 RepID=UPI003F608E20
MRRADRLFQILQILRRQRAPVTAAALAEELETSRRTVYRDVADLLAQRVPIRGEAGTGYVLERGFDMPPLMLTPDEIEVAVLGAQWVAHRGDAALRRAAQDLIAKIAATVPERLRPFVLEPATGTPPVWDQAPDALDLAQVRASIRAGTKIALRYRDEAGRESERVVWPVIVGYLEATRMLMAWCELREDFRSFRTDRVVAATFLKERYGEKPSALRARWRKTLPPRGAPPARAGAAPARDRAADG